MSDRAGRGGRAAGRGQADAPAANRVVGNVTAAQLQQLIDAVVANVAQVPAVAPIPAAAPGPNDYSDTPANTNDDPIDFRTPSGLKMFLAAIAKLDTTYDGQEVGLKAFLQQVSERADNYGWDNVLLIPDANGILQPLLTKHGCLTTTNVRDHAMIFMAARRKDRQASQCMMRMIKASISSELKNRLLCRKSSYTVVVPAVGIVPQETSEVGTLLLYELISMVSIETRATIDTLKERLYDLPKIMQESKVNIEEFNVTVDDIINKLEARNATIADADIIPGLFRVYGATGDSAFDAFIALKYSAYLEKAYNPTRPGLMVTAAERYKILQPQWLRATDQQMELINMRAEIISQRAEIQQLRQNPPKRPATKGATGAAKKTRFTPKDFAWKEVAPAPGGPQDKEMNGKQYIYCPHHGKTKWVLKINHAGVDHRTGCTKAPAKHHPVQGGLAAEIDLNDDAVDEECI